MFKKTLGLTDKGSRDLLKATIACVITNIATFLPFGVILKIINIIIKPITEGGALDTNALWLWLGLGVAAAFIYFLTYSYEYNKTYTVAYKESTNIRISAAERLRRLPLSFFNRKDLSELSTNIMGDCEAVEHVMSHSLPQLIANCITTVLVTIMLSIYDWRMALAMFCVLPLSFGVLFLGRKLQDRLGKRHAATKLRVSDQVQEYLDGIKVVKSFGMAGEKFEALEKSLGDMQKDAIKFEAVAGVFVTLATMLLQIGIGNVIFVGTNLLTGGSLEPIKFLTFAMVSAKIYAPIIIILTMLPEIFYFFISIKRVQRLSSEPIMEGDSSIVLNDSNIDLQDVSFAYNQDEVISNFSTSIPQNAITALVGPSGSGKSTLTRLIARFWDVTDGKILIGDKNIREIEPERLMTYMSFVFQDVVLFNDTIMNNIRIGKQDATDGEVIKAAKAAHCDSFISKMPDGYNTLIGENGCTLSGGERQRVSIARALLKDAPIVLLDEATSSLDPENEVLIQSAISKLVKGRTVIVIAHRLKTIMGANKIIVLDKGKLIEQGTHKQLMEIGGLYSKMVNIQSKSSGWEAINQ
ncbi:MAG: ABC transporter ATP-binding protein [Clostridia bacterium]